MLFGNLRTGLANPFVSAIRLLNFLFSLVTDPALLIDLILGHLKKLLGLSILLAEFIVFALGHPKALLRLALPFLPADQLRFELFRCEHGYQVDDTHKAN